MNTTHPEACLASTNNCEVIGRGPNWLFVHIDSVGLDVGLAERLWAMASQQFTYRIVLEFDPDHAPDPSLAAELGLLCDRLSEHDGALRLCGLDPEVAREVLEEAHRPRLHNHHSAHDAVWCGPCDEAVKKPR